MTSDKRRGAPMRGKTRKLVWNVVSLLALLTAGIVLAGCDLLNPIGPTQPPDLAPTGVTASTGQFEDQVRITWLPVERATSYRVFRAPTRDGDYQLLGSESSLVYTDQVGTENQGRLYWYKVEACNSVGCGPHSVAVSGYAGYPPAPTNVRASTTYGDKIVVSWDPVPGATYYQVYRERNPDQGFTIVPGGDNVVSASFDDTTATPGTWYWYRVKACHANGCSALSQPASGRR
jgi:fibronectin type 3 domain-containing protein